MTENETLELLAIIKVAYPQQLGKISDVEAGAMVKLWATTFAKVSKAVMMVAVNSIVKKTKFFPSIADMCEELDELNRKAYTQLTIGKYQPQLPYEYEMEQDFLAEWQRRKDAGEEISHCFKAEFYKEWREKNVKPPVRNYDEATERNLEIIRKQTADFAVTNYVEHRANGKEDFLLGQAKSGQFLLTEGGDK